MASPLLPAREIRDIAAKAAAALLPLETAVMLPVPQKAARGLEALIVYYSETGPRTQRRVHPPSHAMRIDAATGKILHFGATTPERLGIAQPLVPVPGAGVPTGQTGLQFAAKRDRFLEISRDVWTAYAAGGPPGAAMTALVREYAEIFLQITKAEVAPFYLGAASDFFTWVRSVAGIP